MAFSLLVGCVGERLASVPPAAEVSRDALAVIRTGGDPVSSLRATFMARVERGEDTERARGALLVRRPDRFRMRLSSLLGFTILDYTLVGDRDRLWLAGRDEALSGTEIPDGVSLSPAAVRWIFLRTDERLERGCGETIENDVFVVECRDDNGDILYRGVVHRRSGRLEREVVFEKNAPQLTVAYDDYRPIAGVRLPYSIEWIETAPAARVVIDIDSYEVNPDLPVHLFAD